MKPPKRTAVPPFVEKLARFERRVRKKEDVTSPAAVGREKPRIDLVQGGPIAVNHS
jgi:hypothetical protein